MTAELPQPQPTDAVIVGGARTPFTRLLSQQADLRAVAARVMGPPCTGDGGRRPAASAWHQPPR